MKMYGAEWLFSKELVKQVAGEKIRKVEAQIEDLHKQETSLQAQLRELYQRRTVLKAQLESSTRDIENYYKGIRKDP